MFSSGDWHVTHRAAPCDSSTPLPIQSSASVQGKAIDDGFSAGASDIHLGDSDGVFGSLSWSGPAAAIVAIEE